MKKLALLMLLSGMPFGVFAQAEGEGEHGAGFEGPPRWTFGGAAMVSDSPYAGEGSRVIPIPLLNYQGDRFYFEGITAGWRLVSNDAFELTARGKFRFDGFSVKDLGREELARNGVDYRLLEDRDFGFDVGLGMKWTGDVGELEFELLADATDTSGGQEASLQYGYPIDIGKGSLTPNVGVMWQSKDMANYYYGTLDKEVARGVVDYKPGAVMTPHVGAIYFRPLGQKWSVWASAKYSRLPDGIRDSPLVEHGANGSASLDIGFFRGF